MTNGMEKIPSYKTDALKLLCTSKAFKRLMSNGRYPDITTKQLLENYLFPWEFIPDTTTEEAAFVCCEVDVNRVNSNITSAYILQFYIICHRRLLRMPDGEPGSRVDLLAIEINRLFNGNDQFGLGRIEVRPFNHYTPAQNFYGRCIPFIINDFNRFGEGL